MKINANQLMGVMPIIQKLGDAELSLKMAIDVANVVQAFSKPFEITEKKRMTIISKYADKDENGEPKVQDNGTVHISNIQEFNKEMVEFMNTDLDIDCKSLDLDALANEDIKIKANEYLMLKEFFESKDEKKEEEQPK